MIYKIAFAALLPLVSVLADDAPARARLIGVWQQQDDSGKGVSIWVVETKGNSLHITNSQGDQKLSEIACNPTGAECDGTVSGKKAKVVMYYNGPRGIRCSQTAIYGHGTIRHHGARGDGDHR